MKSLGVVYLLSLFWGVLNYLTILEDHLHILAPKSALRFPLTLRVHERLRNLPDVYPVQCGCITKTEKAGLS